MSGNWIARGELARYAGELLEVGRFNDYCPNGLQVEGAPRVRRIVSGVTASLALIQAAIAEGADTILVHHGWFWRGEDPRVTGVRQARLKLLLAHDINLFAYHLPLDAHPDLGNNAALARVLGWRCEERFGENGIGMIGRPATEGESGAAIKDEGGVFESPSESALTAGAVAARVAGALGRTPLLIGDPDRPVRRVAWCTGGAQSWLQAAIDAGADLYLSGEISEPTVHLARESGVSYLAAGHHATERYGVGSLGEHLAEALGIEHRFVDIDNPA